MRKVVAILIIVASQAVVWLGLWRGPAADRSLAAVLAAHNRPVRRVAFSPDGRYAVTLGQISGVHERQTGSSGQVLGGNPYSDELIIWDLATGAVSKRIESAWISDIAMVDEGAVRYVADYAATVDVSGVRWRLRRFDPVSGEDTIVWESPASADPVMLLFADVGYCGNARYLFVARHNRYAVYDNDTKGKLFDIEGDIEALIRPHAASAGTIMTCGSRREVFVYDLASREMLARLNPTGGGTITAHCLSPGDGRCVAVGLTGRQGPSLAGSAYVYDTQAGRTTVTIDEFPEGISSLSYSPDGSRLAIGGKSGGVYLWDLEAGEVARQFPGHDSEVYCLAFSPAGDRLASGGRDRVLKIWSLDPPGPMISWAVVVALAFTFVGILLLPPGKRGGAGAVAGRMALRIAGNMLEILVMVVLFSLTTGLYILLINALRMLPAEKVGELYLLAGGIVAGALAISFVEAWLHVKKKKEKTGLFMVLFVIIALVFVYRLIG